MGNEAPVADSYMKWIVNELEVIYSWRRQSWPSLESFLFSMLTVCGAACTGCIFLTLKTGCCVHIVSKNDYYIATYDSVYSLYS